MLKIIRQMFAALLSLFIFSLGNGLLTTLLTVRLHLGGVLPIMIGTVTGAYYAGITCGSFRIEPFIVRVGYIRAFATFASGLAVITLLYGIFVIPWLWVVFGFAYGFLTAGLFVVVESWLLVVGTPRTKGQILALYMVFFYGALALGQFLITIGHLKTLLLFSIAAMLSSLSVIPLAMTRVHTPTFDEPSTLGLKKLFKTSASGVIGCLSSGLILGALFSLLPLFIMQKTQSTSRVSLFMALVIFGGMILEYPVGRLSDYIERRIVLIIAALLTVVLSFFVMLSFQRNVFTETSIFVFGGMIFALYPVSISHTCDSLDTKDVVAATQGLLLTYGVGATIGPLVAAEFMSLLGSNGLFIYFLAIGLSLCGFLVWRRQQKAPMPQEEHFISVQQTTPIMSELDPRSEETEEEL